MKSSLAALLAILCLAVAAPAHAESKEFKAGGGIYVAPTFVLAGHWQEDAYWDVRPDEHGEDALKYRGFNIGFGLFGEYALHRHLLLGLEASLAFVRVKQIKVVDGIDPFVEGPYEDCINCKADIMFSLLLRLKIPFSVGRVVSLYPIAGFGFHLYAANRDEAAPTEEPTSDANFAGILAMVGFGVEAKVHRVLSPFGEVRYMLGAGWDEERQVGLTEENRLITHSLAVLVGLRFP